MGALGTISFEDFLNVTVALGIAPWEPDALKEDEHFEERIKQQVKAVAGDALADPRIDRVPGQGRLPLAAAVAAAVLPSLPPAAAQRRAPATAGRKI